MKLKKSLPFRTLLLLPANYLFANTLICLVSPALLTLQGVSLKLRFPKYFQFPMLVVASTDDRLLLHLCWSQYVPLCPSKFADSYHPKTGPHTVSEFLFFYRHHHPDDH